MSISVVTPTPGEAHPALQRAVRDLKGEQPLSPVSVVVPTNAVGVAARRWLGRHGGIAAIDMLTMHRVAEVIGGPGLARDARQPLSVPVIDLTIEAVLSETSTPFNSVRGHPSTIVALRELYQEVRASGPASLLALGSAARGEPLARTIREVQARLADHWFDEADLLRAAIEADRQPAQLERLVLFLPQPPHGLELELLAALSRRVDATIVAPLTGVDVLDREYEPVWDRLGVDRPAAARNVRPNTPHLVTATDADTEVRELVTTLVDAARSGVAFARMAVLWPANEPYARLVEHQLGLAGIPWNGRPGTVPIERVVPRFLLDLLDVDRRGLRREALFEMFADIPGRTADGSVVPVAQWERISRAAGVARDEDWWPRLAGYARRRRNHDSERAAGDAAAAEELLAFVQQLRGDLGHPAATRTWAEWAAWAEQQITDRLGESFLSTLNEAEHLAREHTARVLDRLATLDQVSEPPTRSKFRSVFAAEFDVAPGRLGRLGEGVTVGHLSGQIGLDVDLVVVLGAADGLMPPAPRSGPLLTADDRITFGLPSAEAMGHRMHRQFLSVLQAAERVVITEPRGDLRGSTERFPSRWVEPFGAPADELASHLAAVRSVAFPPDAATFRLHHALDAAARGSLDEVADDDRALTRALATVRARRSGTVTEYDGDLTGEHIPVIDRPISATQIESWPACPHAYFMKYLLGVRAVDDPGIELNISHLDRGNLVHEVLDRLHREVIDGALPQPSGGWQPEHLRRAFELFDEVGDVYNATGRTGRPASWALERLDMLGELATWLANDSDRIAAIGATVLASEHDFGRDAPVIAAATPHPDDPHQADGIRVYGKIDRVLQSSEGTLHVVDYKTGKSDAWSKMTPDDPTVDGTKFQLPVYAAAARTAFGDRTAEVRYSFFKRGKYEELGFRYTDAVHDEVARRLGRVLHGIHRGFFPSTPGEPSLFRPYVDCEFCQPDGLSIDDRYREYTTKLADPRFTEFGVVDIDEQGDDA